MLRTMRRTIKYFTLGLLAGILLAPRKGADTRKLLTAWGKDLSKGTIDFDRQTS